MDIWTNYFSDYCSNSIEGAYRTNKLLLRRNALAAMEKDAYEQLGRYYEDAIRRHVAETRVLYEGVLTAYETLISEINEAFRPMYRKEP